MILCFQGGRVVDPANEVDEITNVYIEDGTILALGKKPRGASVDETIDVENRIVCPGLVDLGSRLREPGHEHKATISSELKAAASSGFTTVCATPDTLPVMDNAAVVEHVKQRAGRTRATRVLCLGALTEGLAGEVLAEMHALKESGCVAVTNLDHTIIDTAVLKNALAYAASLDLTVFLHPVEHWLSRGGTMHDGETSTRLGLPGVPAAAETVALARDLTLVEETGARVHFCRLSSSRAVRLIAAARRDGLPVSADVSLAQLTFCDADVGRYDPNFLLRPPLRDAADRSRLLAGVRNATIEAICADHQPHEPDAKAAPFSVAESGASTLDTFVPALLKLVDDGALELTTALGAVTHAPSRILGIDAGRLSLGAPADVCVIDPSYDWEVSPKTLQSAGHNTPYLGCVVRGRAIMTLVDGRVVFDATRSG